MLTVSLHQAETHPLNFTFSAVSVEDEISSGNIAHIWLDPGVHVHRDATFPSYFSKEVGSVLQLLLQYFQH